MLPSSGCYGRLFRGVPGDKVGGDDRPVRRQGRGGACRILSLVSFTSPRLPTGSTTFVLPQQYEQKQQHAARGGGGEAGRGRCSGRIPARSSSLRQGTLSN